MTAIALKKTLDSAHPTLQVGAIQHSGAVLHVDLGAIVENWRLLKAQTGGRADCAAVLKADAYGLGAVAVAGALSAAGCRRFFVAHLDEGITLRPHLPAEADLFVLHGVPPGAESACAAHGLIPVLNSLQQIIDWSAQAHMRGLTLPAALQVDSGMSRLGLSPCELSDLIASPDLLTGIDVKIIMSHLACADEPGHPMNAAQLASFRAARAHFPMAAACFSNSSGVFLGPDYHFDLLRPGAALYGVNPTPHAKNPMRPVVRLSGKIMQTRRIAANTPVGYGASHVTRRETCIATVSVGYADGFLRCLGGKAVGHIGRHALPVIGRVSMDTITLDATSLPEDLLFPGCLVDLIGPETPVDALAAAAGTIGYEILTSLGARYHRQYSL